ncbi:MAG TPA: hypothetical protein PKA53_05635, partial [Sphingobacterium sp.]|nr:hypothetical protein [Sphingobacterium sp.]
MVRFIGLIVITCFLSLGSLELVAQSQKSVLIFSKTTGFRHKSIPKGVETVSRLLDSVGIKSVHSEDVN